MDDAPADEKGDSGGDRDRVSILEVVASGGQVTTLDRVIKDSFESLVQGVDVTHPDEAAQLRLLASRVEQGWDQVESGGVLVDGGAEDGGEEVFAHAPALADDWYDG